MTTLKKKSRRTARPKKAITPAQQEALRPLEQEQSADSKLKHYMNLAEIALKDTSAHKSKTS